MRRLSEFRLENLVIFVEEVLKTYLEVITHLAKRPDLVREILSRVSRENLRETLKKLPREKLRELEEEVRSFAEEKR